MELHSRQEAAVFFFSALALQAVAPALMLAGALGLQATAAAGPVEGDPPGDPHVRATVVTLDQRSFEGDLIAISPVGIVSLATDAGAVFSAPLDDILEISIRSDRVAKPSAPWDGFQFELRPMGRLLGQTGQAEEGHVLVATDSLPELRIPFDRLLGIRLAQEGDFPLAHQLYLDRIARNDRAEDSLITRELKNPRVAAGIAASWGAASGVFVVAGERKNFDLARIYGLVFASSPLKAEETASLLQLSDGAIVPAEVLEYKEARLRVRLPFVDPPVNVMIPIEAVTRLDPQAGRAEYLSDLEPVGERTESILGAAWPWRRDANVLGGPIQLDGVRHARGLGMRARTTLTYDLARRFQHFVAAIGVDDCVHPRGRVTFRLRADDAVLFEATVGGRDVALPVSLDVTGVKMLTLEADYGPDLDLADYADWADARLLKVRKRAGGEAAVANDAPQ